MVKDGRSVRFWLDLWSPLGRLCDVFPALFSFCSSPGASISELAAANLAFGFRRLLSPVELEDWHPLTAYLPVLSKGRDEVVWTLTRSGVFSVKSLYAVLVDGR